MTRPRHRSRPHSVAVEPSKSKATSICAEIERLTANFAKAVTNKDFATLGPFYDEHARLLAPGSPMVKGRAAIQPAQQRMIEAAGVQALGSIEAGDLAIEIRR